MLTDCRKWNNHVFLIGMPTVTIDTIIRPQQSTIILKHGQLHCKRPSFTRQKAIFHTAKHGLLQHIECQALTQYIRNHFLSKQEKMQKNIENISKNLWRFKI